MQDISYTSRVHKLQSQSKWSLCKVPKKHAFVNEPECYDTLIYKNKQNLSAQQQHS